jgi:hypothetical protein
VSSVFQIQRLCWSPWEAFGVICEKRFLLEKLRMKKTKASARWRRPDSVIHKGAVQRVLSFPHRYGLDRSIRKAGNETSQALFYIREMLFGELCSFLGLLGSQRKRQKRGPNLACAPGVQGNSVASQMNFSKSSNFFAHLAARIRGSLGIARRSSPSERACLVSFFNSSSAFYP